MDKALFLRAMDIYHNHWGIHETSDRYRGLTLLRRRVARSDNLQNLLFTHGLFGATELGIGNDLDVLWSYIRVFMEACLDEDHDRIMWVEDPYERMSLGLHAPIRESCLDRVAHKWRQMGNPLFVVDGCIRDAIERVYAIVI